MALNLPIATQVELDNKFADPITYEGVTLPQLRQVLTMGLYVVYMH